MAPVSWRLQCLVLVVSPINFRSSTATSLPLFCLYLVLVTNIPFSITQDMSFDSPTLYQQSMSSDDDASKDGGRFHSKILCYCFLPHRNCSLVNSVITRVLFVYFIIHFLVIALLRLCVTTTSNNYFSSIQRHCSPTGAAKALAQQRKVKDKTQENRWYGVQTPPA